MQTFSEEQTKKIVDGFNLILEAVGMPTIDQMLNTQMATQLSFLAPDYQKKVIDDALKEFKQNFANVTSQQMPAIFEKLAGVDISKLSTAKNSGTDDN